MPWDRRAESSEAWRKEGLSYGCVCQRRGWEDFLGSWRMYESWLGIGKGSLWAKAQRHEITGYIRGTLRNVFELCITSVHYYHFAAYFQFVSFVQLNYKLLQGRAMSNLNSISLLQWANVCKSNTELFFTGDSETDETDPCLGLGFPFVCEQVDQMIYRVSLKTVWI